MKKRWMNILRVLISTGALVFLFWKIGLGETLTVLRKADLRYWLAALALFILSLVMRASRWFILIRGLDLKVPFGRVVRLYFIGAFFNVFLPTQFGGDVVRALELTQDTDSSAAVGTVLLDRMTGLMVLFAMGLVVLPFHATRMVGWLVVLLIGVSGGGLIAGILVLEGHLLRKFSKRLPAVLSLEGQGPLANVYAAVTGCGWRAVTGALGVSVVFNLINVLVNWLCGETVGADINLGYFFVVTSLLSVSGLVPSIGGWGVREATSTAIFAPIGTGENTAAALGVALGAISLTVGLFGAIVYGVEAIRGLRAHD